MIIKNSFTIKYPNRQRELSTKVTISDIVDTKKKHEYDAVWDTGATNCAISNRIVSDLDLKPIGRTQIATANGCVECNRYRIRISLPNNVRKVVTAPASDMGDTDVLIGMDIIGDGDFAITSNPKTGQMALSYCSPSSGIIDFVEQSKKETQKTHKNNKKRNKQERQNRKKSRREK